MTTQRHAENAVARSPLNAWTMANGNQLIKIQDMTIGQPVQDGKLRCLKKIGKDSNISFTNTEKRFSRKAIC